MEKMAGETDQILEHNVRVYFENEKYWQIPLKYLKNQTLGSVLGEAEKYLKNKGSTRIGSESHLVAAKMKDKKYEILDYFLSHRTKSLSFLHENDEVVLVFQILVTLEGYLALLILSRSKSSERVDFLTFSKFESETRGLFMQ
eukprot:TRINITY_DN18411_c0_g1_i2.p1 TRINITY_DN18411_c0_g1~~TRINITY_DN18411_c0_g1_i2.p1  ORF type:complete len:143 (-),score=13.11 TRINITY_DN18411_c0_g1_i2:136-564(-)